VEPHETVALECIREPGLKLQVIFNREAVRVLPSGVIKATGRKRALEELQLAVHNIVAIGDSENEHAFIDASECAVAVANGVPSLREHADFVTSAPADAGVLQVIAVLLRDDFNAERALDASSLDSRYGPRRTSAADTLLRTEHPDHRRFGFRQVGRSPPVLSSNSVRAATRTASSIPRATTTISQAPSRSAVPLRRQQQRCSWPPLLMQGKVCPRSGFLRPASGAIRGYVCAPRHCVPATARRRPVSRRT
jgi:hypothetical protein